jgi:hypothetical protein
VRATLEFQYTFEEFKEAAMALAFGKRRPSFKGGLFGWVLFGGLSIMLFVLLQRQAPPAPRGSARPTNPPQLLDIVLPMLPWVFVFAIIWFVVFRALRRRYQNAWDTHPDFHRLHTVEIDEDGITWSDPVSQSRRLWDGYVKFKETPHLFLVYRGEMVAEIIPKRAFSSADSINEFRVTLQRNIRLAESAFPVIPIDQTTAR